MEVSNTFAHPDEANGDDHEQRGQLAPRDDHLHLGRPSHVHAVQTHQQRWQHEAGGETNNSTYIVHVHRNGGLLSYRVYKNDAIVINNYVLDKRKANI